MTVTKWVWRRKEQLPDGRWQHYCIRCNKPHTEARFYEDDFTFRVRCEECEKQKAPTFTNLTKSHWE